MLLVDGRENSLLCANGVRLGYYLILPCRGGSNDGLLMVTEGQESYFMYFLRARERVRMENVYVNTTLYNSSDGCKTRRVHVHGKSSNLHSYAQRVRT